MHITTRVKKHNGALSRLRGLLARSHGGALIELALMMPAFTIILVGAAEFGRLSYAGIEVANAARAGVEYGAQSSIKSQDTAGIQNAAKSDAPEVPGMTAVASTFCTCSSGTAITCANSTACTARVSTHVQVTTSASIPVVFHLPGLPTTYTLNGKAEMRVLQ